MLSMSTHIKLLVLLILVLVADESWALARRKKIVTPSPLRKSNVKINQSPIAKKGPSKRQGMMQLDGESSSSHEDRIIPSNRKIVLREITRKPTSLPVPSYVGKIGKGSMFFAENAYKITKSTVKASFDLLAGKRVSLFDISGTWRAEQHMQLPDGSVHNTPLIFHLFENKTMVTLFNDIPCRTKYTFQERAWPRYCTLEFDARAYQGPSDKDAVEMTYKGYFKKSILNSRILFMKGSVHKAYGKFFWRGVKKVGDFNAVKKRYGS